MKLYQYFSVLNINTLISYSLFFSFALCGCDNNSKPSHDYTTMLDLSLNQNSKLNETQIILKKIIPLETTKNCAIGTINKILIKGDKLIIVDFMKSKLILNFDLSGKFIKQVSNIGKARGEYLLNRDFLEKSDGNGFYLFDKKLDKLLEYDNDLNFIEEFKVPISINSLVEFHNGSFFAERSSENKFFITLCDRTLHAIKEQIRRPNYQLNYDFNNPFPFKIKGKNNLTYNPSFSNIIYEYKDNDFIEKYFLKDKIGFPNQSFFESNIGVHPGRLLPRFQKENFLSFLDFYENDYYLLLKYYRGKDQNITIYNKKESRIASYDTSDNDIISCLLNNVLAIDAEGSFISYIFPYQISEVGKDTKISSDFNTMLPKVNSQDNPLIFFFDIIL